MDTADFNRDAPIHASLLYHNSENTKLLLEYKADLELSNGKGRKPIHNANDTESLELLLDHGADINARDKIGKIFIFTLHENKTSSLYIFLVDSMVLLEEPRDSLVSEKEFLGLHSAA